MNVVVRTIRTNRGLILVSLIVFLFGSATGFVANPIDADQYTSPHPDYEPGLGDSAFVFTNVFEHNVTVYLILLVGAVTLGMATILNMFYSGLIIGVTVRLLAAQGYTVEIAYWILPHSVLELPALWLAGAAGLLIPSRVVEYLSNQRPTILRREDVKQTVVLATVSFVLLAVAAIVETQVTPWLSRVLL